ncbi:MAG: PilZ domain-containing protein [Elusimicrobiota bacterium]
MKPAESGRERRSDIRVPLNVPARIRVRDGAMPPAGLLASDISRCGLCLEGNADLAVGGLYIVDLCLPDGAHLSGTLKVVWRYAGPEARKFGAQLVRWDMWSGRRIKKYVGAYCSRPVDGRGLLDPGELLLILLVGMVWFKVASDLLKF